MRKLLFLLGISFTVIAIVVNVQMKQNYMNQQYGFEGMTLQEKIAYLEEMKDEEFSAAIYGNRLEVRGKHGTMKEKLREDEFYLSIAPYVNSTHPCDIHNLTGCQGEWINQNIQVHVFDLNGNLILEEETMTYDNGFFGIWLPKNIEGIIRIESDGMSATGEFSTYDTSNTCMTSLQLKSI